MNSWPRFFISLRHAKDGVMRAIATENNFRIHLAIAVVVVIGLFVLGLDRLETAMIIFLISTILTLELVNTVVERFVDLLEPRIHPYAGIIKDMLAAAVLITSIAAVIIGALIFWPHIKTLLNK